MPLLLVLHDPSPGAGAALSAAVWDLSESHWRSAPNLLLVETGVSAEYLAEHLRAALGRAEGDGAGGPLLVAECASGVASGWPGEAGAWIRERLAEPPAEAEAA